MKLTPEMIENAVSEFREAVDCQVLPRMECSVPLARWNENPDGDGIYKVALEFKIQTRGTMKKNWEEGTT